MINGYDPAGAGGEELLTKTTEKFVSDICSSKLYYKILYPSGILCIVLQTVPEKTEILTNVHDIDKTIHKTFSNISNSYGTCIDASGPGVVMSIESMKKRLIDAHARGIKIRFLTEITTDNLPYCKQMMQLGEMRHLDGIQGNFGVSETEYLASATLDKEKLVPLLIYSNVKQIVKQQQFVFQTLWNKAIPGEQRIEEIELGKEHEFLEVCPDRREATSVTCSLLT